MELRHIRYFLAVARLQHFRKAAAELNLAQPALSRQIKDLESELGVVLLDRDRRSVQLTDAGSRFLRHAERILQDVRSAEEEMLALRGVVQGRVVVGEGIGLGGLNPATMLASFRARYPGVQVSLREETTPFLLEWLRTGEIDLAFIDLTRTKGLAPPGFEAEPLASADLMVVVGAGHRLAQRSRVALKDLADEPFVMFKAGSVIRELVETAAARTGYTPNCSFETNDRASVRDLISGGLGLSIAPPWLFPAAEGGLKLVQLNPPRIRCVVGLAQSRRRSQSPAVAAFIAHVREPLLAALNP